VIDIPDLGDDFHQMWTDLVELSRRAGVPWTLIGAHMVALHGWEAGRDPVRPSDDADVLVDARAVTQGTRLLSATLLDAGYQLDGITPQGIGHRFVRGPVRIDVLAPDGLGERASVKTAGAARTVQVPGGTQALNRTESAEIRSRSKRGAIPRPNLLGAILIKVRAIVVDDVPDAQRQDVAFLLSLIEDPQPLIEDLSPRERSWLRRHGYFGDPGSPCWRGLEEAESGVIAFRRLADATS
jgi:hypothetical protein